MLAQPVNRTMDFDTSLRHAANTMYAGKSMAEKRAGMAEIKKSVMDAAYVGGTTRDAALEAMNTMVASGAMSDEAVKKLLPTVMKTATAANTEGNDIANIVTKALQAGFKEADIPSLLDRALQSGADGGFELKDMSRWLPQQLAAMKNAGMGATLDNFSSLLNANQLSFMTAGNTDEAGNNLVNLLAKINSQDIVSKAKKITLNGKEGFDFTASMNKRQAAGMNSLDALVDIVAEITAKDEKSAALMKQINAAQGDETKLALLENQKALVDGTAIGQLVSDRQALMALGNNRQELARLQAGQANAAGAVDGSYGFLAEGSGFKKAQFSLAKSEAEYGAFEKFSDRIGGWMQSAAQWMRGHPEQAQTATQVGYGATAASAAAVSAKAVSGGGGGFWSNWGSKLLGSKAGFGLGLLLHSEELNKGEAEFVALQRQYAKKRASTTTQAPLDSPVLKDSILQLDQSAQTNQQASQQYMQAAAENQAATAQMTGAAAQMTAAAAQMQAAAGRPIPVTVTVQNGNIVAYVNQAVERNSRKN